MRFCTVFQKIRQILYLFSICLHQLFFFSYSSICNSHSKQWPTAIFSLFDSENGNGNYEITVKLLPVQQAELRRARSRHITPTLWTSLLPATEFQRQAKAGVDLPGQFRLQRNYAREWISNTTVSNIVAILQPEKQALLCNCWHYCFAVKRSQEVKFRSKSRICLQSCFVVFLSPSRQMVDSVLKPRKNKIHSSFNQQYTVSCSDNT